jgi:phospholipid/cholesterol/gamma-HCH transport system substrate-binding protein
MIIGFMGSGFVMGRIEPADVLGRDFYSVYAQFESVAGLKTGNPVKMLGVKIGRVSGLKMDQDNQKAMAKLKIYKNISIYDDAFASIKMEGLIGENYVSIDPGGSGEVLVSGEIITETESLIDIAALIGKYAFGNLTKNNHQKFNFVLKNNSQKVDWLD